MPWRIRRVILLILFGAACAAIAVIVYVTAKNVQQDLLATGLLIGGVAILVVALPTNGHEVHKD